MAIKRLIKCFEFTTRNRPKVVFSDKTKIRLNDDDKLDQGLTLRLTNDLYPLGNGHTVTTWTVSPKGLKKWMGFEASEDLPAGTSIGYRLDIGAGDIYWNGSSWAAATLDAHWNTMAEVQAHIQALVLSGFDFKVKVNLRTTDQTVTPKVRWIKILVQVSIEPWDDLIYDTVIRSMRANLRATTAIQVAVVANTTVLDLGSDYKLENSGYNFTSVKAVYNLSTDPNKFTNLATGYTPGASRPDGTQEDGQVALSATVNAGEIVRIEMEYEPEIAVFTNQDYYEPERLPVVVFERIQSVRLNDRNGQELNDGEGDVVRDMVAMTGVQVPPPRQSAVRFEFACHASPLDLASLNDAMDRWISQTRILKSWAFDEEIAVDPVQEIETGSSSNLDDVTASEGVFQLRGVPFYVRDAIDVDLVENVNATYET